MMSGRSRLPFTATQWQELEHQALIFKYMVSGMPIPPDLLFTIKTSPTLDSSLSSTHLFPHQPQTRWNYLQMGLGRKVDPEPGRCRRTDGKKWRCSKEAYPDSKYCERHMHRGKNRSRKPVELITPSTPTPTTNPPPLPKNHLSSTLMNPSFPSSSPTISHSLSSLSSITSDSLHQSLYAPHSQFNNTHFQNHFIYSPHSSSSSRPPGNAIHLSPQHNTTTHSPPDYRSRHIHGGLEEVVDEHAFFTENSRTVRSFSNPSTDDSLQLTPLTMRSSYSKESRAGEYSNYLQLQNLSDASKQQQKQHEDHQNCCLLGRDLRCESPSEIERDGEQQKGIHHFFDEWAPKSRNSLLNTQLSISIPNSSHDFPIFNSRTHNDGVSFQ